MTLWKGNCYAHVEFERDQVLRLRKQFPDARVVVHPESLREVRDLADAVCSTEKMIAYCKNDPAKRFVIVTESGIIHRMQKECPGKEFLCAPVFDVMRMPSDNCRCSECKYMKLNTLEKLRDCMKNLSPRIELPEEILRRARLPIERMLEISARPIKDVAESRERRTGALPRFASGSHGHAEPKRLPIPLVQSGADSIRPARHLKLKHGRPASAL